MINYCFFKVCETLFGEAPTSTYQEAVSSLENAEKYSDKPDIDIKFYLGQSYIKIKSYKQGVDLLREIENIKPLNSKQEKMQKEAKTIVSKNSKYC